MSRRVGSKVRMSLDALDNYGWEYESVTLTITHVATKSMPAKEFFELGQPSGYHPGYDDAAEGQALYDFEEIDFSLYDWEIRS